MEVQEVKEQLKAIFRQVINNNKVENWNEQDHPRDKQGKFTFKHGGATVDVFPDGKYADIKIYAPEGKAFPNGDTWYSTQKETDKAEEQAKEIIDETFGEVDKDNNDKFIKKETGKTYTEETYDEFHKRFYKENEDKWRFKSIIGGYTVSRTLDGKWGYSQIKPKDIDKYLTEDTIRVSLANRPEMRKDEEGTYDWYEDDKKLKDFQNKGFEVSDKYNDGYFTNYILRKNKADNSKEQDMAILDELKKLITKVENEKGDDMADDKEKNEVENENVDKRKLIDEVGGILKGKVDDEVIRTIIGKLEKVAYDKSEAGTADNEKEEEADNKKCKNEDDEKEVKEDVENKCKNSVDNSKTDYFKKLNEIYNSASQAKETTDYVSRADREKAAEDYFAK